MDHSSGVYIGKQVWISTYDGYVFRDREVNLEEINRKTEKFITSDKDSVIGNVNKETALTYYAYSFISRVRVSQKRVYRIICGDDKAEMYIYEGFERETPIEMLHQTEHLEKEESERLITAKHILDLFISEFPNHRELESAQEKVQEYEEDLYNGGMTCNHESVKKLIDAIHDQIEFVGNIAYVELFGNRIEIQKTWYTEEISKELADSYRIIIRKLIGQISNNLEKDDIVSVFLDRSLSNRIMERYLGELARDMYISIKTEPYFEAMVSRGNAYYNYIVNHKLRDRIQRNIGLYSVEYDDFRSELSSKEGKISFINKNDFNNCHIIRIKDIKNSSISKIEMYVPFSISGTIIEFTYSYEAAGLNINIRDCNCEEVYTETIKYTD